MTAMQGVRADLRRLRQLRPDWSLSELGRAVGVSRQRVHQLLVSEGLPTRSVLPSSAWARRRYLQAEALEALEAERAALDGAARGRVEAYLQALGLGPGASPGATRDPAPGGGS